MPVCDMCNQSKMSTDFGSSKGEDSVAFNANITLKTKKSCKACLAEKARNWRLARKGYDGTGRFAKYSKDERKLVSAICTRLNQAKQNNKRWPNNRRWRTRMQRLARLRS